jgi:hypothetical protein
MVKVKENDIETIILWWTNNGSFDYNHYMKVIRAKRKLTHSS